MNPSAKAAGLSFQLSSPQNSGTASWFRDDGATIGRMTTALLRVCGYRPHSECKDFTGGHLTPPNLASLRFSSYLAVCSGLASLPSAFSYADYTRDGGFPMAYLMGGSDSSSARLRLREASSEQPR
jgi:hypothetical protein